MSDQVDFVAESRLIRASLVGGRGHYDSVVKEVMDAKTSVWIATANLKELLVESPLRMPGRRASYRSVLEVFDELASRGVELRVLHAGFPSQAYRTAFDRFSRLVQGGLVMKTCVRVHLKAVIIDGRLLYLGSANWTGAGLGAKSDKNRNFELGIVTEDEAMLDQIQGVFEHLWTGGECRGCGRKDVCEAPLDPTVALVMPKAARAAVRRTLERSKRARRRGAGSTHRRAGRQSKAAIPVTS